MSTAQPLVLDALSWLYLMEGESSLGGPAVLSEVQTAGESAQLYIASPSVGEVLRLEREGAIRFSLSADEWLSQALDSPGLRVVDVDARLAVEIERLPSRESLPYVQAATVATARVLGARLLTHDAGLKSYAESGFVRLL